MDVGVSIPRHIWDRKKIEDYARVIDDGPFSSINFGERICFEGHDSMMTLGILAGLTKRVKLMNGVLILPIHNPVLLAKQAATLYHLSGGRYSMGVGTGPRKPEFDATRGDWYRRGKTFEQSIHVMRRVWAGQPPYDDVIDNPPPNRKAISTKDTPFVWENNATTTEPVPPVVPDNGLKVYFGGFSDVQLKRAGRLADGLNSFEFAPDPKVHMDRYAIMKAAWDEAGRPGKPKMIASTFFALGPDAENVYRQGIADAYGYDEDVKKWALGARGLTSAQAIRDAVARFEDAGIDELNFAGAHYMPPDGLKMLADAIA
jgi:alkanesulfonate monooxygenase SsuD/methylene tetrahydromethanopterin reductase-like flavin-dependent oxidoreductase (luciferase family)